MEFKVLLAIMVVFVVWAASIVLLQRMGAGYGARSVICPHTKKRASISTSWKMRLGVASCDVLQCSLLPNGKPITCDKSCLVQL